MIARNIRKIKEIVTGLAHYLNEHPVYLRELIVMVLCWISLGALEDKMPILFRISICLFCDYGVRNRKEINSFFALKTTIISRAAFFLLYIYAAFAFCGIYFLDDKSEFISFAGTKVECLVITLLWCPFFVNTLIWIIANYCPVKRNLRNYWLAFFGISLVGLCISCIWLYAYNPAITSNDSQGIYSLAMEVGKSTFSMTDWQPPMYVFFVALLQHIWNNITFMIVLQLLFFWIVLSDALLYCYCEGSPLWLLITVYVFFTLGYSNQIQLVTFWKDIPYATALLWLTLLLIKGCRDPEKYNSKLWYSLSLFFSLLCLLCFRQNGILIVGAMMILLPLLFKKKNQVVISILLLVIIGIIRGPIYKINHVVPQPSLKYIAMTGDMMYLYFNDVELDEESIEIVERMIKAEEDMGRNDISYNPYFNEYYHGDLSDYDIKCFAKIYLNNFKDHPIKMLKALLRRTQIIWSISKPDEEATNCVNYLGEANGAIPETYPHRINNLLTRILGFTTKLSSSKLVYIFLWKPGIYNLIIIMLFIWIIVNAKNNALAQLLPVVPILLNIVSYVLTGAWPDYRYHWPSVLVCWLLMSYCYTNKTDNRSFTANE